MLLSFIAAFAIGWILRTVVFARTNGANPGIALLIGAISWPVVAVSQAIYLEMEHNILVVGNNAVSQSVGMSSLAFAIGLYFGIKRKDTGDPLP